MENKPPRIPSLTGLRALEAAIRHRSVSKAAEELFVTHSAVSKQVQALEKALGVMLIRRLPRSIEPTHEGARLAETLGLAFALIQNGITQLNPNVLSVRCTASVMNLWLIPRLSRLQADAPELNVSLSIMTDAMNFMRDGIDIAIRSDRVRADNDVIVKKLMPEMIGPVCSPGYALKHDFGDMYDLRRCKLLVNKSRANAWSEWQEMVGWKAAALSPSETYEHFFLSLQSAASGLGVAVAPRYLVMDDIASGRLVAPFGFAKGQQSVVAWVSLRSKSRKDVRIFLDWLEKEAARTVKSWSDGGSISSL